jgi:ATP-binding cassette subfamily A (ABC1) protein 3
MVDVGVDDKKNSMAGTLSGGNKRKLSVAIALVAGSKFLIFDEPTAGMDLNARRHLWECLKVYKKNRIILMSTHYMDEADILGDRIGIMTGGKLSAVGSSIFLKTKFGIGYNMILVKDSIMPNTKLMPYLKQHLGPLVVKTSEIQSEITLKIASEYSVKFSKFFDLFDNDLQSLDIRNYGISISTLEEVFMKIGHVTEVKTSGGKIEQDNNFFSKEALNNSQIMDNELVTIDDSSIDWGLGKNAKDIDTSFKNNLKAVLYKRFRSYKNGKFAIIFEIAPIVMGIVGICMVLVADEWSNSPPVIYSADLVPRGS